MVTQQRNLVRAVLGIVGIALAGYALAAGSPPNLGQTLSAQLDLVADRPYDAEAHNDLGNLLVLDGRYEEAEVAYAKAIELAPESTLARFNLGVLLQQVGRSRDAAREFRRLLEIDDRHARTYYQLGMLQQERKQRSAALESYARAFALDPDLTFPQYNPHIIDNRLATEAMLLSRDFSESPSSSMPRLYGEPERIAELMLDGMEDDLEEAAEASAGEEGEPAEESEEGEPDEVLERQAVDREEGAPRARRQPARGSALRIEEGDDDEGEDRDEDDSDEEGDDEEDDDEEEGRRQLTHADLDAGSTVGQAQSKRGAVSRQRPGGRSTGRPPATSREQIIQRRLQEPERSGQPAATGGTPSNRPRYRPASRFSTGRLELRLLQEETEPAQTARG